MTATQPLYCDLGPTATYRRRRAGWFPGRGEHTDDRLGTLRLILDRAKKPGDSSEVDNYGVQEETVNVPPGCRSFLLVNDTDDTQPDAYRCVVSVIGHTCTCKAGSTGRACKHGAALAALMLMGALDAPQEPQAETCGYCCGGGQYPGPTHDRFGYELTPRMIQCEYCGGFGQLIDGHKLLPHRAYQ